MKKYIILLTFNTLLLIQSEKSFSAAATSFPESCENCKSNVPKSPGSKMGIDLFLRSFEKYTRIRETTDEAENASNLRQLLPLLAPYAENVAPWNLTCLIDVLVGYPEDERGDIIRLAKELFSEHADESFISIISGICRVGASRRREVSSFATSFISPATEDPFCYMVFEAISGISPSEVEEALAVIKPLISTGLSMVNVAGVIKKSGALDKDQRTDAMDIILSSKKKEGSEYTPSAIFLSIADIPSEERKEAADIVKVLPDIDGLDEIPAIVRIILNMQEEKKGAFLQGLSDCTVEIINNNNFENILRFIQGLPFHEIKSTVSLIMKIFGTANTEWATREAVPFIIRLPYEQRLSLMEDVLPIIDILVGMKGRISDLIETIIKRSAALEEDKRQALIQRIIYRHQFLQEIVGKGLTPPELYNFFTKEPTSDELSFPIGLSDEMRTAILSLEKREDAWERRRELAFWKNSL
tara:strand:+ start:8165 stop:9577 length:1413 start_codon:yes stop_codon:yes gene_type:complete